MTIRLSGWGRMGAAMNEHDLWVAIKELVMPVAGPAAGAVVGYFAAKRRNDAEADAVSLNALTAHFTALIDGYERRINDLTDEIVKLRAEIVVLRKELDSRTRAAVDAVANLGRH